MNTYSTYLLLLALSLPANTQAQSIADVLKAAQPNLNQTAAVTGFYQTYAQEPVWISGDKLSDKGNKVWEILQQVEQYGFNPAHYQTARIKAAIAVNKLNLADVYLSDGLANFCRHLHNGTIDPATIQTDLKSYNTDKDAECLLELAYIAQDLNAYLEDIQPHYPAYKQLLKTLQNYRDVAAKGGWALLPDNIATLDAAQQTKLVAERLLKSGDWDKYTPTDAEYALEEALRKYQRTHTISETGKLDAATLQSINVPVEKRVSKIKLNLERLRWLPNNPGSEYIFANIPAYTATMMKDGKSFIQSKVIVGTPQTPTAQIVSKTTKIVINPTWTVPHNVTLDEILPKIIANPNYLKARDMEILNGKGEVVNLSAAELKAFTRETFKYDLRQRASDDNSLGRFVLYFPNALFIYMHDTNKRELFDTEKRSLSHGCVRTQEIEKICYQLIQDNSETTVEAAKAAFDSKETTSILLKSKIGIYLQYLTVWAEGEEVYFLNDIYGLDKQLHTAMNPSAKK